MLSLDIQQAIALLEARIARDQTAIRVLRELAGPDARTARVLERVAEGLPLVDGRVGETIRVGPVDVRGSMEPLRHANR